MASSSRALVGARIATDIGGTFTDTAAVDARGRLRIGKSLTTPRREADGVLASIASSDASIANASLFVHGTTLVINALLERRGARTAFVTTAGFGDVVALGRGNRPEPYSFTYERQPAYVSAELRFELQERMRADGTPLIVPSDADIDALAAKLRAAQVESIAIGFLHSYRNPAHEDLVAARLRALMPDTFVTTSSSLGRQWREYERFTSACANAYVGPITARYIGRLIGALRAADFAGTALFLDAGGGAVGATTVEAYPIRLVESGPVGGVIGAARIAEELGLERVVTLDVGGTTAKSTLIENGHFETLEQYWVGGYERGLPVQVPVVDIHEVGAGGGSIAHLDRGRLRVGPRSAGAEPGPAAYGRGGTEPTVTDALTYCGLFNEACFLAEIPLRPDLARAAVARLAQASGIAPDRLARGILTLSAQTVATAVRRQTLERGLAPEDFTMIVSGGAGPSQACAVAEVVGIRKVLVPPSPGHFSAIGMLRTDLRFSRRAMVARRLETITRDELATMRDEIASAIRGTLDQELRMSVGTRVQASLAMRYLGQDHHLRVPLPDTLADEPAPDAAASVAAQVAPEFERLYRRRYGYVDAKSPIEVVDLEVTITGELPALAPLEAALEGALPPACEVRCMFDEAQGFVSVPACHRASLPVDAQLEGPALVYEAGSISVLPPGWTLRVLPGRHMLMERAR